jgi:hypothetical protein
MVSEVTSDSFTVEWVEPNDTGGVPIVSHIVSYTAVLKLGLVEAGKAATLSNKKEHRVSERCTLRLHFRSSYILEQMSTGSSRSAVRVVGLPANTDICDINIIAINKIGEESPPCSVPNIKTLAPLQSQLLKDEIERTRNSTELYIDSSFYTGAMVRRLRLDYLKQLEKYFKKVCPSHRRLGTVDIPNR